MKGDGAVVRVSAMTLDSCTFRCAPTVYANLSALGFIGLIDLSIGRSASGVPGAPWGVQHRLLKDSGVDLGCELSGNPENV